MDLAQLRRRVVRARVARLATVGADARPHIVPICFALVDVAVVDDAAVEDAAVEDAAVEDVTVNDVVYTAVDHKPKRGSRLRRISNIEATRHACLLVDEYAEDWTALWWVRLDGAGRVVADAAEARRAVAALVDKYAQYAERPPSGPLLAIDVLRWSGWSGG